MATKTRFSKGLHNLVSKIIRKKPEPKMPPVGGIEYGEILSQSMLRLPDTDPRVVAYNKINKIALSGYVCGGGRTDALYTKVKKLPSQKITPEQMHLLAKYLKQAGWHDIRIEKDGYSIPLDNRNNIDNLIEISQYIGFDWKLNRPTKQDVNRILVSIEKHR